MGYKIENKVLDILSKTDEIQKDIISHTYGCEQGKPGYRNRYIANHENPDMMDLLELGLMKFTCSPSLGRGNVCFYLTTLGIKCAMLLYYTGPSRKEKTKLKTQLKTTEKILFDAETLEAAQSHLFDEFT